MSPCSTSPHLCEAEVQELGAGFREHHVAGFQVAMNDAAAVGFVERVRNLEAVLQELGSGKRALFESGRQRLPFEIFHHQIINSVLVAYVVERADVRMIQAGNGASFAIESLAHFRRAL